MTGLPTLTLHQPYASLVMAGTKTIETRSWAAPKGLIGRRIGIHAGKSVAYGRVGGTLTYDGTAPKLRAGGELHCLPRGVLLGTAVLTDCVPMVRLHSPDPGGACLGISDADGSLWLLDADGESGSTVNDQAPLGRFKPGHYAWLLADPKPITEECPWCQGSLNDPARQDEAWYHYGTPEPASIPPCPVCVGDDGYPVGKCDPIPARGRQRVWRWTPDEVAA